jgi:hypothetical protein
LGARGALAAGAEVVSAGVGVVSSGIVLYLLRLGGFLTVERSF